MNLTSIEPTPNPNSMKLCLDESMAEGISQTYTAADKDSCPDYVRSLLDVTGVRSVFRTADFVSIQRDPHVDWQGILTKVREAFGEVTPADKGTVTTEAPAAEPSEAMGEVKVELQMFRSIPMLVKVTHGSSVVRAALPERFTDALNRAASSSPNMLMERKWVDQGPRYGDMDEIAAEVVEEFSAAYDDSRLDKLVANAFETSEERSDAPGVVSSWLPDDPDWRKRYAALVQIGADCAAIGVFLKALDDQKAGIRRLAAVYLGLTKDAAAVLPLCRALEDPSVSVRRTVGDSLSDLADARAIGPMTKALEDPNKLVRWRAARFLYETGDETALTALCAAQDDPEFEIQMQVRMAIERIEGGESARGPIWQQMMDE